MPLSAIVTNFYYTTISPTISAELSELSQGYPIFPFPVISAELSELLDAIPTKVISAEMQGTLPELLILLGVDTTSGQYKTFSPGDNLVKSNGSAYLGSTGLRGPTGIRGATGLPGDQGQTGLFTGATGIRGITGTTLNGVTGLQGDTGVIGLTGLQPVKGSTGLSPTGMMGTVGSQVPGITGVQGLTGLVGITGLSPTGLAGIQGNTGILGPTGVQGITGFAPLGISPQGSTGILAGPTGVAGTIGSTGIYGIETVFVLTMQRSTTDNSLSFVVPANTLDTNEQQLEIITWGLSSTNGAPTTILLTFGGETIISQSVSGTAGNPFFIRSLIIRVTGSSQECNSYLVSRDGDTFGQRSSNTVNLATDQTLQISASASGGQSFTYVLMVRKVTQI